MGVYFEYVWSGSRFRQLTVQVFAAIEECRPGRAQATDRESNSMRPAIDRPQQVLSDMLTGQLIEKTSSGAGDVRFVRTSCYDPKRLIRQRPLHCLGLIPGRAHPYVALLVGCEDRRDGLGMHRSDDCVSAPSSAVIAFRESGKRKKIR
jgi:hypothetical protein